MKSLNYDPSLCYFAMRFDKGISQEICCFAMHPNDMKAIDGHLNLLKGTNFPPHEVKKILHEFGARKNDFYDCETDLIYPGELSYNKETQKLKKITFHHYGEKNNPTENFPGDIVFSGTPKLIFYNENEIIKNRDITYDYHRNSKGITVSPENETKYQSLLDFIKSPEKFVTYPELKKDYAVKILKPI